MATLAKEMTQTQLEEILSKSTNIKNWEKSEINSPIALLVSLKRKRSDKFQFLDTLIQLFEGVSNAQALSDEVHACVRHLNNEGTTTARSQSLPNGFYPNERQRRAFNNTLLRISQCLSPVDFEILKAMSRVPDGLKERLHVGHKLFGEMKNHGDISENNVELLLDFFTHMNLTQPLNLLTKYKETFRNCTEPTAPSPPYTPSPPTSSYTYQSSYHQPPQVGSSPPHPYLPSLNESHTLSTNHIGFPYQEHNLPATPSPYHRHPNIRNDKYPHLTNPHMTTSYNPLPSTQSPPPAHHPTMTNNNTTTGLNPSQPGTNQLPPVTSTAGDNVSRVRDVSHSNTGQSILPVSSSSMANQLHLFQQQHSLSQSSPVARQPSLPTPPPTLNPANSHTSSYSIQSPPSSTQVHTPQPPPPTVVPPTAPSTTSLSSSSSHERHSDSEHVFSEARSCTSMGECCSAAFHFPPAMNPATCSNLQTSHIPVATTIQNNQPGPGSNHPRFFVSHPSLRNSHPISGCSSSSTSHSASMPNFSGPLPTYPGSTEIHSVSVTNHPGSPHIHPSLSSANCSTSPHHPSQVSHTADQQSQPHYAPIQPPTATPLTQHSILVHGGLSSPPGYGSRVNNSVSRHHSNPRNAVNLQYHSHNNNSLNSTLFSSNLSPHVALRGEGGAYVGHEPSTRSLVDKYQLSEPHNDLTTQGGRRESDSIPEEEGENRNDERSDESSESEHSSLENTSRKRTRQETESSEASQSSSSEEADEDDEVGSVNKRIKTEEKNSGGVLSSFRSFLGRFSWSSKQKKTDDSDDEKFEDANED